MKQPSNQRFKNNQNHSEKRVEELLSRQKSQRRRLIKRRRKMLVVGLSSLLLLLLFFTLPFFRIQEINLAGFKQADQAAITSAANKEIGRHVLFARKNKLKELLLKDPIVDQVNVSSGLFGKLTITVEEYPLDYYLSDQGSIYLLNRSGRVLRSQNFVPKEVTKLLDDTTPLAPGNTIYGKGVKRDLLLAYAELMDQNSSAIQFQELDVMDLSAVLLQYQGWTVELGEAARLIEKQEDGTLVLRKKLNAAINTINTMIQEFEPGIIDLRFDVEPAYRPKGD